MKRVVIEDAIFERYPDFHRGLVIVSDIDIRKSFKPLRRVLRERLESPPALSDPRLLAWEDAHRRFGSDPDQFPPSITSLAARVAAEPNLPFINSAVACFNAVSLSHALPCGGDDVGRVEGDLVLGLARGDESFVPLGAEDEAAESPEPGEVIYFDSATRNVMCRRWNWRNGDRTKITETTKRLVINVDGLTPVGADEVRAARDELAALLVEHASARLDVDEMHAERREVALGSIFPA